MCLGKILAELNYKNHPNQGSFCSALWNVNCLWSTQFVPRLKCFQMKKTANGAPITVSGSRESLRMKSGVFLQYILRILEYIQYFSASFISHMIAKSCWWDCMLFYPSLVLYFEWNSLKLFLLLWMLPGSWMEQQQSCDYWANTKRHRHRVSHLLILVSHVSTVLPRLSCSEFPWDLHGITNKIAPVSPGIVHWATVLGNRPNRLFVKVAHYHRLSHKRTEKVAVKCAPATKQIWNEV